MASPSSAQRDDFADRYAERVLDRAWVQRLIASENARPSLDVTGERYDDLAVLLHERLPLGVVGAQLGWSDSELSRRLGELADAGLAREDPDRGWVPTLMVMSAGDVARYMPVDPDLVAESAALVAGYVPEARRLYERTAAAAVVPFEHASLLVLSNVLLDNGQINYVEAAVLGTERPLRGGGRYYYAVQEDATPGPVEAFGIYGNQFRPYGRAVVGVYGNRRSGNRLNFIALDADGVATHFGSRPDDVDTFKTDALAWFVESAGETGSPYAAGFESLGWTVGGAPRVAVLGPEDQATFDSMARGLTVELVDLLNRRRGDVEAVYSASPYADEVSFEEYFMWWYHLYYTAVTDRLIAQGHIEVPSSGISSYVVTF